MSTEQQRIESLESRVLFQDETIQQLSDALIAQQRRIDTLEAKLDQIRAIQSTEGNATPADEKPPHY